MFEFSKPLSADSALLYSKICLINIAYINAAGTTAMERRIRSNELGGTDITELSPGSANAV